MEHIYLKFPTIEDKREWIDYVKETKSDNPEATPGGYKDNTIYEEWLRKLINEYNSINLEKGRVPSSFYFLMNENRILGSISIRHNLEDEMLKKFGGHIGYNVRPSERRKGYATLMLSLALEKCAELGIEDIMVTCKEENIGSAKTIENNCGELKEIIFIPEENCNFKKYWINVKEALNKKDIIRKKLL